MRSWILNPVTLVRIIYLLIKNIKCLFLIVSMWLHRRFLGFWTIWCYLNWSFREVSLYASSSAPSWKSSAICFGWGKLLLISGSLKGRYTCGNLRMVKKKKKKPWFLFISTTWVSRLVHCCLASFFLPPSCCFRLFSMRNSFSPNVHMCMFHF